MVAILTDKFDDDMQKVTPARAPLSFSSLKSFGSTFTSSKVSTVSVLISCAWARRLGIRLDVGSNSSQDNNAVFARRRS
ncbi:hypothetical protein TNCV_3985771 [Trichonephila clavipes]|nr:hypothetical protein TNCV_3985771 [Trichonephila clavipes]